MDTIIHFVCFITDLGPDEFIPKWEYYAKELMKSPTEPVLHHRAIEGKKRYRYVSHHEGTEQGFLFNFMKERRSEHFPEHNVRVVHAGGYVPLHVKERSDSEGSHSKLIIFTNQLEADTDFYSNLPLYHHLTIFQAFYESCVYSYIIEFIVDDGDAGELEQLLKQRPGTETGIYKESLVHII